MHPSTEHSRVLPVLEARDCRAWLPSTTGRPSSAIGFALVAGIWLVLRVVYFNGYYVEDAPGYVTDAIYLATGNYHARDYITGLNVGTYLPVALPLALFGKSEIALSLWPLVSSLLGLLSVSATAAILFGRRFGLLAGLLYATGPGDVFFSTVVMPDAIQAGWLAFSVFLIVSAHRAPASRRYWRIAAGGMAMGLCNLVRGNGVILLPIGVLAVVVFALVESGPRPRSLAPPARGSGALAQPPHRDVPRAALRAVSVYLAGWLTLHAVEGFAYLWATGDFFHRVTVVNRHYGSLQSIAHWGLNTSWTTIPASIFAPLVWWREGGWGTLNQEQAYHGWIFCLAVVALVLGGLCLAVRRSAASRQAAAGFAVGAFWFAWPLLYHQFGSQSLTQYVPIHRLSRHLVVYAPGAILATVAGGALIAGSVSTWRSTAVRRALGAAAVAVLAVHLAFNWQGEQVAFQAFHRIKGTYERIRAHLPSDVRTIVGDPGDLGFFDFWLNPLGLERVHVAPFADYARCDELPKAVVLTWCNPGWEGMAAPVIRETVKRLPCLTNPPESWHLLYGGFPEKVYLVAGESRPHAGGDRDGRPQGAAPTKRATLPRTNLR